MVRQSCRKQSRSDMHEEEKSRLLEQLYVHDVYERIATDFDNVQHRPWARVKQFLDELSYGSIVADIGCGNGHYLSASPHITVIGVDRSQNLLQSAHEQHGGLLARADCLALPYRDQSFDAIICIGLLHHLVSSARQARAMKELTRILRPGGKILLTVWAWEQRTRKFRGQNMLVPRLITEENNQKIFCKFCTSSQTKPLSKTNLLNELLPSSILRRLGISVDKSNDCKLYPSSPMLTCMDASIDLPEGFRVREFPASSLFQATKPQTNANKHGGVIPEAETTSSLSRVEGSNNYHIHTTCPSRSRDERFYHVFKEGEIAALVKWNTKSLSIDSCIYEEGNWCAILVKNN